MHYVRAIRFGFLVGVLSSTSSSSYFLFVSAVGSIPGNTNNGHTTMNSNVVNDAMLSRLGASIMAESALVDKETARIYWEGGSINTLSSSIDPYISIGLRHVKATILSCILFMAVLSFVANQLHDQLPLLVAKAATTTATGMKQLASSWSFTVLLFVLEWTILKIPDFNRWFVITIIIFYLIESYTCSTHQYLSHAISSDSGPANENGNSVGVEEFIESLRNQSPIVTWKVRSFHYERRKLVALFPLMKQLCQRLVRKSHPLSNDDSGPITPSFLFTKKVVTHKHEGVYEYKNCRDSTTAGVWKRAPSTANAKTATAAVAPFTKIVLSKLLVLENAKTRQDYFQQQTNFVTQHGQQDEYAEFSTDIHIDGFQRRLLAVRTDKSRHHHGISSKLFRKHMFWVFTCLGLTVPYRSWFSKHCDELRVTVVKETSCDKPKPKKRSYYGSWFSRSSTDAESSDTNDEKLKEQEAFRQRMQELALYRTTHKDPSHNNTKELESNALMIMDNMEAARIANDLIEAPEDDQVADVPKNTTEEERKENSTSSSARKNNETEILPFDDADVDDGKNNIDNINQDRNNVLQPIVEDAVATKNTTIQSSSADTSN